MPTPNPLCLGSGDPSLWVEEPANIYRHRKESHLVHGEPFSATTLPVLFTWVWNQNSYLLSPLLAFCQTQNSSLLTHH